MNSPVPSISRQWTDAQIDAIHAPPQSLLVSAAAGSGKTSVLAERCAHLVCDSSPSMNVSHLLVLTFSIASAGEMKSRIAAALRSRRDQATDPELSEHLRRQVALIDQANVSTIHAFCLRLIQQNFQRLGIDPTVQLVDNDQALLLRSQVVRALFADHYESAEPSFLDLIDHYAPKYDGHLSQTVVATHLLLASLLDPAQWIAQAQARLQQAADLLLNQSELGRLYVQSLSDKLNSFHERSRHLLNSAAFRDFHNYRQHVESIQSTLDHWLRTLETQGLNKLSQIIAAFDFPKLKSESSKIAGKDLAKKLVDSFNNKLKQTLKGELLFSEDDWRAGIQKILPHARQFLSLVSEFGQRYQAAKIRLRALDFSDLERLSLQLLRDPDAPGLAPSSVARHCHQTFKHVLIDEYQDVNEVQDAIIKLASRECLADQGVPSNLFCVGDVKQSIYRFRLAEPQRFLERAAILRTENTLGRVIDLQSNFRSRHPLLAAINELFARIMTQRSAEIDYDQTQFLHPGADFPKCNLDEVFKGAPVELHLLPKEKPSSDSELDLPADPDGESDRAQREATAAADCLHRLMGNRDKPRACVFEKGTGYRPLEWRDCVILLRSIKFQGESYVQALRAQGVPAYVANGSGFFEAVEIRDVLALLHLLNNARQDLHLAAVLRSPLANLSNADDAFAQIRLAYPPDPSDPANRPLAFHEAAVKYAAEKNTDLARQLAAFFTQLNLWRSLAHRISVADLVWRLFHETGYLAYVAGLENGRQRSANLLEFHSRARQFGSFSRQGLRRFLDFMQTLDEASDPAAACQDSEADNVVRIMSVHASKGLEYPVVIIPDLAKKINFSSAAGSILADRATGLGLKAVDVDLEITYPTLAHEVVRDKLRDQSLAEEMRILYVAMTRAKEHLILIGTVAEASAQDWQDRWQNHAGPIPAEVILAAASMLDWIGPAVAAIAAVGPMRDSHFKIVCEPAEKIAALIDNAKKIRVDKPKLAPFIQFQPLPTDPDPSPLAAAIIERLGAVYAFAPFADLQAKQAVTIMTKGPAFVPFPTDEDDAIESNQLKTELTATLLPTPQFLLTEKLEIPTDRGTAVHLALEHFDLSIPPTLASIQSQLAKMVDQKFLTQSQAHVVDAAEILWLFTTPLGEALRQNAHNVRREIPFNYAAPAEFFLGDAFPSSPLDQVMVRGQIDLLMLEGQTCAIVDYKTDRVNGEQLDQRVGLYRGQMNFYRKAISAITGREVTACYLAFLHPRQIIEV